MQSGLYRGHYGNEKRVAHKGAIRGVETDLCNQRVITVGADDRLKFWHFKAGKIIYIFNIKMFAFYAFVLVVQNV